MAQLEQVRLKLIQCLDPLSIFEVLFQLDEETCIKVCILFWIWWHERNKANAGDEMRAPEAILSSINYHAVEFRNIKHKRMIQKEVTNHKWSPPPREFLKINTDGAYIMKQHTQVDGVSQLEMILVIYLLQELGTWSMCQTPFTLKLSPC
jgi:hypothetical protein